MTKQDFEDFSLKLDSPIGCKRRHFFTENRLKQWCFSNYYKYYVMSISKDPKFKTITSCYKDDLNWLLSLNILPQAVRSIVGKELECFKKKTVEVLKQEIKEQGKEQPAVFNFHGDIHGEQVNIGNFEPRVTKKRTHDVIEEEENEEEENEEEEPEKIDNDDVHKFSRDIFDLDNEFITITESEQLDMNEILPSTARPASSPHSSSITRSLLFNWAFKLYLNKSVTMPATTLAVIRDHNEESISNRLTKFSGDLLAGWSTATVDDDYRNALSFGLSLIVDVSDTKPSKKLLACLSNNQVQDIKSHVKKEKEKVDKLPENLLSIFKQAFELFSTSGEHDALLYLTKVELKELEEKKDSINLQFIEILKYIIRSVEKWSDDNKPTEVDWTHRLVSLLDILLRDSSLSIRMGEKASLATKIARQENELRFGNKEKAQSVIGRKIDVIIEQGGLELSASEWKSFGAGDSLINKQHSKNLRVNACVLLQLLQLPYNNNVDNLGVLTMEWRGAEGDLISIKKVNEYYIACKIGRMYLPTSVDDISDFYATLELLLYWKDFHLKLQKLIKTPLARLKRLKRDNSYQATRNEEEPSIFFTPTRGNTTV
ncbi:hypothetical protein INT45_005349 [Circinella minor]|uniref:Uncharacterized protein n=1 Tax=Circinella minor TaxID=1195481 RepID=A0A8H7VEL6_9FUNG|nr:hypothetical protein INT45_005349 [Circinella minor]